MDAASFDRLITMRRTAIRSRVAPPLILPRKQNDVDPHNSLAMQTRKTTFRDRLLLLHSDTDFQPKNARSDGKISNFWTTRSLAAHLIDIAHLMIACDCREYSKVFLLPSQSVIWYL